jgi:hypothetical protein
MKTPIGFVKSYPKMILKPTEQPQYEGGDLVLVASGILIEPRIEEDDE